MLDDAHTKLYQQNAKTLAAVKIKTELCKEIYEVTEIILVLRNAFRDSATTSLNAITEQLKELRASLNEKLTLKLLCQLQLQRVPTCLPKCKRFANKEHYSVKNEQNMKSPLLWRQP